jgi:hypothetical protein
MEQSERNCSLPTVIYGNPGINRLESPKRVCSQKHVPITWIVSTLVLQTIRPIDHCVDSHICTDNYIQMYKYYNSDNAAIAASCTHVGGRAYGRSHT